MEHLVTSNLRLGIIAGGQLAKMLIQDASKWDIATYVLDADEHCPARSIATGFHQGSRLDPEVVYRFGKEVDFLTFEIESIHAEALKRLRDEGLPIAPDPSILELIQDKGSQKEFLRKHGIPSTSFQLFGSRGEVLRAVGSGELRPPFVQKLRKGGYDGRAVVIVNDEGDLANLQDGPCLVEERVEIHKEIAVTAARNRHGEVRCYPVVEMVFDPRANLVDYLVCPASLEENQAREAQRIARAAAEALQIEGLLAVEFFVDRLGQVLVNEMAPRPHNSGHHTIESVVTSQFEQHLRAIFGLPLGSTRLKLPAVMVNLLGAEGHEGPVRYQGLTESLAMEGVKIHLYGKKTTRPYRKMGHVTVIAPTVEEALERAHRVKKVIRAIS